MAIYCLRFLITVLVYCDCKHMVSKSRTVETVNRKFHYEKLAHAIQRFFFPAVKNLKFHYFIYLFFFYFIFYFSYFCSKHRLWVHVRTTSPTIYVLEKKKNKKNGYTPAYPSFTILKWGLRGIHFTDMFSCCIKQSIYWSCFHLFP